MLTMSLLTEPSGAIGVTIANLLHRQIPRLPGPCLKIGEKARTGTERGYLPIELVRAFNQEVVPRRYVDQDLVGLRKSDKPIFSSIRPGLVHR